MFYVTIMDRANGKVVLDQTIRDIGTEKALHKVLSDSGLTSLDIKHGEGNVLFNYRDKVRRVTWGVR